MTALCPPSPPGACAGSREAEQHTRAGLHHASRAWSLLASAHAAAAGPRARTRGGGVWATVSLASFLAARYARVARGRAMRVGRDGAPRHRARRIAHTHGRTQPRTRGQARAGGVRGSCRALRVAHEAAAGAREARARRGRVGRVRTARRAALRMRESTPLPCTSARSLWLCSLLLSRSFALGAASEPAGQVTCRTRR